MNIENFSEGDHVVVTKIGAERSELLGLDVGSVYPIVNIQKFIIAAAWINATDEDFEKVHYVDPINGDLVVCTQNKDNRRIGEYLLVVGSQSIRNVDYYHCKAQSGVIYCLSRDEFVVVRPINYNNTVTTICHNDETYVATSEPVADVPSIEQKANNLRMDVERRLNGLKWKNPGLSVELDLLYQSWVAFLEVHDYMASLNDDVITAEDIESSFDEGYDEGFEEGRKALLTEIARAVGVIDPIIAMGHIDS